MKSQNTKINQTSKLKQVSNPKSIKLTKSTKPAHQLDFFFLQLTIANEF